MKTIRKSDFTFFFWGISEKLTLAELRLLYLLIIEPDIMELPQQEIAVILNTHRRTVNIGLKNLKKYGFIKDEISIKNLADLPNFLLDEKDKLELNNEELNKAKEFILELFLKYYRPNKTENIIVNEDFFMHILGDYRLHSSVRYTRAFIQNIIMEAFPKTACYLKSDLNSSGRRQKILSYLNLKLVQSQINKHYSFNRGKFINDLQQKFSLQEEEALRLIRTDFPVIVISKDRLRIPKPWRGSW